MDITQIKKDTIFSNFYLKNYSLTIDFSDFNNECEKTKFIEDPYGMIKNIKKEINYMLNKTIESDNDYDFKIYFSDKKFLLDTVPFKFINNKNKNLVSTTGIVIYKKERIALQEGVLKCRGCGNSVKIYKKIPNLNKCNSFDTCPKNNPYILREDKYYSETQLKIQEFDLNNNFVPNNLYLIFDYDTEIKVGFQINVIGVLDDQQKNKTLNVLGFSVNSNDISYSFEKSEVELFLNISKNKKLEEILVNSIAPEVFGLEDAKKSILCVLFGGTPKTNEKTKLRGDIHAYFVGPPGTAKSQLSNFVKNVSPISYYTVSKGNTKAGLTASVIKSKETGEFYVEAGALVLADGGVLCIDEFDKMDKKDRGSIHEAMEQQSIIISKSGIKSYLNCRTSLFATGNYSKDTFGIETSLLSRFDIILNINNNNNNDQSNDEFIKNIFKHHKESKNNIDQKKSKNYIINENDDMFYKDGQIEKISPLFLKKYISYCKCKYFPIFSSDEAKNHLKDFFVKIRNPDSSSSSRTKRHRVKDNNNNIVITYRQLETLIRISESQAKMHCRNVVEKIDVEKAIKIFSATTLNCYKNI
ncbi:hypothetical protein DICPUDRAFT_98424 [Dictyostelium purpureum]|uniref:DNA helicase n=1 Tax=Dictyostelium purpureum TaxID=5786 RepID=F0ZQA5_DICPU|nr:uncharacterized protein DICPUDRAFT_98424 [Dictyostelium purpureum]EGC33856.1 hypothetical protein DICPUDRAFT_98424 [Dictyostelium purpureum]|eukprot:XP_003289594.1 hypothetical protein DICPUDRAFT_98424 [Dictyostelium purpureum]